MSKVRNSPKKPISVEKLHAGAIKALRIAAAKALARHAAAGVPAAIWKDGKVVQLSGRQLRQAAREAFRKQHLPLDPILVTRGSGNVFLDIGVSWPKQVQVRAQVVSCFRKLLEERKLAPQEASKLLGIPQSKVSCLMNGKLSMFSLDHLFALLNALDREVEIIIRPRTREERVAATHVFLATTP